MRIVILDGEALNPGDLSWDGFAALGDLTVYGHTLPGEIFPASERLKSSLPTRR